MPRPSRLIAPLVLTLIGSATTPIAFAGFGDLLKQVEEQTPQLLQQSTNSDGASHSSLDTDTLIRGLKQALEVGTQRAVDQVSQTDGYLGNPSIRIPLPSVIDKGAKLVGKFGGQSLVDDFELSINRAAEKAAPLAAEPFLTTLKGMSFEDARRIYEGSDDAATRYFQDETSEELKTAFAPIIRDSMEQVGVTSYYQALVKQASQYPLVGNMNLDLESYVTDQALVGLFTVLAEEEKRIREEPLARSTELLKQVFGN
ncbi:DUF4197 domain-containing protein [Motiliproteus coralliicola]|uniref:DUF4197 domain-containing protein n=1 Tax=Motiliproteus coralliicola TaxID=2283196 RepID=A0A369WUV9_9GAMM|nr:DUF4197 domain-containing protein [Motiliproteus coralliicola]RDE24913.1 DUF4197 domain-containing protein [Motiliproteus coralliicola]